MRYTEARLDRLAIEMLRDIDGGYSMAQPPTPPLYLAAPSVAAVLSNFSPFTR